MFTVSAHLHTFHPWEKVSAQNPFQGPHSSLHPVVGLDFARLQLRMCSPVLCFRLPVNSYSSFKTSPGRPLQSMSSWSDSLLKQGLCVRYR